MTEIHLNAHDLCRTRLCQAANCENDAEPGWALCRACDRRRNAGKRIEMHIIEQPRQPDPAIELICTLCSTWKLDEFFSRARSANGSARRRGRKPQCKDCDHKNRREYRKNLSPEKRAAQQVKQNEARERKREAERAMKAATRGIR